MKRKEMKSCVIETFAGCKKNGKDDATASGGFNVIANDQVVRSINLNEMSAKTAPQAHIETVDAALGYLIELFDKTEPFSVTVKVPDQTTAMQLQGERQIKNAVLKSYHTHIDAILTMPKLKSKVKFEYAQQ